MSFIFTILIKDVQMIKFWKLRTDVVFEQVFYNNEGFVYLHNKYIY